MKKLTPMLGLMAVACLAAPVVARADVKPGDKIDASNVAQIKDLVSPGIEWLVQHGMPITVVETKPISLPKKYQEATEKYSGQVKLSPDGRRLEGWVAGLPFPKIDPADPQAAQKIAWNFDRKPLITDDLDSRNFDADVGTIESDREMGIERHYLLDHLRRLMYVGITRAQKELTFTLCKERRQYGELVRPEPSRFLLELPQDDLIWEQERKVVSAEERMQKGQSHLANLKAMMAAKRGK